MRLFALLLALTVMAGLLSAGSLIRDEVSPVAQGSIHSPPPPPPGPPG